MISARRSRPASVIYLPLVVIPQSWRHSLARGPDAEHFSARALLQRQRERRTLELARAIQQLDQRRGLIGLAGDTHRGSGELQRIEPGRRSQQMGQLIQCVQILAGLLPEIVERLGAVARVDGFAVRLRSPFCAVDRTPGSAPAAVRDSDDPNSWDTPAQRSAAARRCTQHGGGNIAQPGCGLPLLGRQQDSS